MARLGLQELFSPENLNNLGVVSGQQPISKEGDILARQAEMMSSGLLTKAKNHFLSSLFFGFVGNIPDPDITRASDDWFYKNFADLTKDVPGLSIPTKVLDWAYTNFISPYGLSTAGLVELLPSLFYFGVLRYPARWATKLFGGIGKTAISGVEKIARRELQVPVPSVLRKLGPTYAERTIEMGIIGASVKRREEAAITGEMAPISQYPKDIAKEFLTPAPYLGGLFIMGLDSLLASRGIAKSLSREYNKTIPWSEPFKSYWRTGDYINRELNKFSDVFVNSMPSDFSPESIRTLRFQAETAQKINNSALYADTILKSVPNYLRDDVKTLLESIRNSYKGIKSDGLIAKRIIDGGRGFVENLLEKTFLSGELKDSILKSVDSITSRLAELNFNSNALVKEVINNKDVFKKVFEGVLDLDAIDNTIKQTIEKNLQPLRQELLNAKKLKDKTLINQIQSRIEAEKNNLDFLPENVKDVIVSAVFDNKDLLGELVKTEPFTNLTVKRLDSINQLMKELKDVTSLISKNIDHIQANDIFNQYINAQKVKEAVIPDEIKQTSDDFRVSTAEKNKIESDLGKTDGIEDMVKNNVGATQNILDSLNPEIKKIVEEGINLRTLMSDTYFDAFMQNISHLPDGDKILKIREMKNILDPFGLKRAGEFIQSTGIKERIDLFKKYEQSILGDSVKLSKQEKQNILENVIAAFDPSEIKQPMFSSLVFNTLLTKGESQLLINRLREALIANDESVLNEIYKEAFNIAKKFFPSFKNKKYSPEVFADLIDVVSTNAEPLRIKTDLKTGIVGSTPEEVAKSAKDKLVRETLQTNDELQKVNEVILKADELNALLKSELGIDKDEFSKIVLKEEEKAKKATINFIRKKSPQSAELIRRIQEESVNLNDVLNEGFIKDLAESVRKEIKAKPQKTQQEILRAKLRNKLSGLLQRPAKEQSGNISLEQQIKSTKKGSEAENLKLADTLLKDETTPETKLIERETFIEESNILDKIKSVLSEQESNILQYIGEGKTVQEISRLTGISREDILKSINQATQKLQKIGIKGVNIKIK